MKVAAKCRNAAQPFRRPEEDDTPKGSRLLPPVQPSAKETSRSTDAAHSYARERFRSSNRCRKTVMTTIAAQEG